MQKKFLKSLLSILIVFLTFGLKFNHSHATPTTATPLENCRLELENLNALITYIQQKDIEKNTNLIDCLAFVETKSRIFKVSNESKLRELNQDPRIQLFKDSYNKVSNCFYPVEIPTSSTDSEIAKAKLLDIVGGKVSLETFKAIDSSGDNNCEVNTPNEMCLGKLEIEKQNNPDLLKVKIQNDLYGCYGNSPDPKNLIDSSNNELGINNFEVFNEEKGLIANTQQRTQLKKLTENQAGPVIGFINMIIDYLVGIVFVLCMASLIYGGYNLIFAGFDSDMTERGKNSIKYAITGFFFIMLSYTIVILVQSIF